jgi:hypothetical protein
LTSVDANSQLGNQEAPVGREVQMIDAAARDRQRFAFGNPG